MDDLRDTQKLRDVLLELLRELLPWAVRSEERGYCEPIPRDQLSNELRAVVEKTEAALCESYEETFAKWIAT